MSQKITKPPTGEEYLQICDELRDAIDQNQIPYASFPELSLAAWKFSGKDWYPQDYDPKISTNVWVELLQDPIVFTENSLQIMKRILDCGGEASCTQLANKYGEEVNFYNAGSSSLAQRVAKKTGCEVMRGADGNSKWWPVLYLGKDTKKKGEGVFIWKLRDELTEALGEVDLSEVALYANSSPAIWKISEGTDSTGVAAVHREAFLKKKVVVVDSTTGAMGKSKVTQGEAFCKEVKKGDYFYLCFGNSIQLLGQFTSDEVVVNPELQSTWYERSYQVIAQSKDTSPYTGTKMGWTPNYNSTCIKIDSKKYSQFEELLLLPYFGRTVEKLMGKKVSPPPANNTYTKKNFLQEVYLTEKEYDKLSKLLERKKNIIIQGAPGVGKTFAAKRLAYAMMGEKDEDKVSMIQFHQSYSYEDFIMGLRPDESGKFTVQEGTFYRFCKKAEKDSENKYFFIIDEINRGNMSKIFGELFMLIESDKRGEKLTLPYREEEFSVPSNIYIIGLMNTADRSLALLDYALRRRFAFYELRPAFNNAAFKEECGKLDSEKLTNLLEQVRKLNEEIGKDTMLGEEFCLGHSYFCNLQPKDVDGQLEAIVEYDLIPLLKEYWFDDKTKCSTWATNLRDALK